MAKEYIHHRKDFTDLLRVLNDESGIEPGLIEKDYWIMHVLYGLKKQGYTFQLKGGTSLSKAFGIIDRFSEDIDIHIDPPADLWINQNPNNSNEKNIQKKKAFYDQLAEEIKIDGILKVERDIEFDDARKYNSGGIRLFYESQTRPVAGLKEGILLEAGFDDVAPNKPVTISSWAYDKSTTSGINVVDNRAVDILCYDPAYTFVEKLQTIATKFRNERELGKDTKNYMRQYYDVYSLLNNERVLKFIGTEEYLKHKEKRFPGKDFQIDIHKNEAFLLSDKTIREKFKKRYEESQNLYYKGQPPFEKVLECIRKYVDKL